MPSLAAGDWQHFLSLEDADADKLRRHERTGRPLGDDSFIDSIETALARAGRKSRGTLLSIYLIIINRKIENSVPVA
jgi:hypothetical protein